MEEFGYLWTDKKESYVLVKVSSGYCIYNEIEKMVLLIEDNKLKEEVIKKMIDNGVKIVTKI